MKTPPRSTTAVLIKKSSIVVFFTVLAAPFGYLIKILYSYTLPPELFGLIYALVGFVGIFKPYQDLGFSFSLSFYAPKLYQQQKYRQLWLLFINTLMLTMAVSLVLVVGLYLAAPWLTEHYFKMPQAQNALYVFGMYILATSVTTVFKNLYIGLQKELYYSVAEVIRLTVILVSSAVAWFLSASLFLWYVAAWCLAMGLMAIYYAGVLWFSHPELLFPEVRWTKEVKKKLVAFTIPHLSNQLLYFFINQTGLLFLTYFTTVTEVGVYNIVLPIVGIPSIFLSPLQGVFFPMVSKFMDQEPQKVRLLIENVLRIIPFLTVYFNFFIIMFPTYTIGVLFSEKWVETAREPLIIIALGYIFSDLSSYLTRIADGMGLMKERVKILGLIATVNVLIGAILIKQFGVTGLVVTNSLVFLLTTGLVVRLLYQRLPFSFPWLLYGKYLLFLGVWFFVIKQLNTLQTNWFIFITTGLVYSLTTMAFALTQGLLDQNQLQEIMGFGHRVMHRVNGLVAARFKMLG